MTAIMSALPIIVTMGALILGVRSLQASLLGVIIAIIGIVFYFPLSEPQIFAASIKWLPIILEVLFIVGGGLLLSDILKSSGGQEALANWVKSRAGKDVGAVLLVVHGVTPFAESVTGFGIGITVGIPLLIYLGLSAKKAVIVGLLGLCAVPWGSMGPGTLIAATMSGVSFNALGTASAVLSIISFVITGAFAAGIAGPAERKKNSIVLGCLSGFLLTVSIAVFNVLFGTAPAGALGSLIVIIIYLTINPKKQDALPLSAIARHVLGCYMVLLGGVLIMGWFIKVTGASENWRYLASPALWLFIAVLWFSRIVPLTSEPFSRAWQSWLRVAPVTGVFMLLGILMAVSGMATCLAQSFAKTGDAYLFLAPFIGALGGFVTGSNSGANAMFAATQAEIARTLGVNLLWFMAAHNVAASFLLMASPSKVEMAIQLAPHGATTYQREIQLTILGVALIVVTLLGITNFLIGFLGS